jgi:hypothetical protein
MATAKFQNNLQKCERKQTTTLEIDQPIDFNRCK